jgi:glycosyltransferase involved in cell wall biosynthesis
VIRAESIATEEAAQPAPLVSVILPVYNREASVARAISSVLSQTYPSVELIVVDDGSTDGTGAVVEGFGEQIKLIRRSHIGAYAARNAGLRQARGEFVAFIDSDDAWLADKLELQMPLMERTNVALVFGDVIHLDAARDDAAELGMTSFRISAPQRGRAAEGLTWRNFVPTCTALVRRSSFEAIGAFLEATEVSADYLAWFRIALCHEIDYVDRPVAKYTVHSEGISYDLGKSLAARIEVFSRERECSRDPAASALLARLLFNLSARLAIAALRGRASSVAHPWRHALQTARRAAGIKAPLWLASFFLYEARARGRRLFS